MGCMNTRPYQKVTLQRNGCGDETSRCLSWKYFQWWTFFFKNHYWKCIWNTVVYVMCVWCEHDIMWINVLHMCSVFSAVSFLLVWSQLYVCSPGVIPPWFKYSRSANFVWTIYSWNVRVVLASPSQQRFSNIYNT